MNGPSWAKWLFGFLVFVVLSAGFLWLSGALLFLLFKTNPLGKVEIFTWFSYWEISGDKPELLRKLKTAAMLAAFVSYGVPLLLLLSGLRSSRKLHGDARFANEAEVKAAGLLQPKGILVGKLKSRYLSFGGQQFVLVAAPTRSGKGVGIVIPNLFHWSDSVVVLDIKQENFELTAGFRKEHGQEVYLFNPFAEDKRSHRYNPLDYVRNDEYRVSDLQGIAKIFYPGEGKDSFFDDAAGNLFLGLGLYLCETPSRPRTIGELLRLSSGDGQQSTRDYIQSLITQREEEGNPLSKPCIKALHRFCSTSDNTLSSIMASFNAPLSLWANPVVDAATSTNDFDLREVRKKRMSIYVGITPNNLDKAGRLLNLFFSQLVTLNTAELPIKNPALCYSCLLLLDEFTAMGKVQIIAKSVSYIAGYNLRLLPIIQSKSQLVTVYGAEDAKNFVTNHALQVIFAPREEQDAKEYSELLGYQTIEIKSKSRQVGGKNSGGRTVSISEQRRALLLPQEIRELGIENEIISIENCKPILCKKIVYYKDKNFTSRQRSAPVVPLLNVGSSSLLLPPNAQNEF